MAATQTPPAPPAEAEADAPAEVSEASQMTRIEKLAALLTMLGTDGAVPILKNLAEDEVEAISVAMAKCNIISKNLQDEILREFTDVAQRARTSIVGGVDYTKSALEGSVGRIRASSILSRVSPSRTPVAAMQHIADMDARQIFNLTKHEQPQTVALIISYLSPEKSADLFTMMRPDTREQVIERLATLSTIPVEVVETIVAVLNRKAGGECSRPLNQTGGLKTAARMLNSLDKNVTKSILFALDERNPELSQSIRQKMFTFEDLTNLDVPALQKVLREVEMRDLAVALKTASDQLRNKLLGCISKRAAETVAEESQFMGALKLRDIEASQMKIIEVVRRLESEGELEVNIGKKGD
ncbi:flagellar motor switch protein FliG [Verrucomicrobiota bacterium]|nr:flagellar motor switch protein FliG [Verrucomicrobiota bacterium]